MKDLKNIEDLFKESFNDFEITPPVSVKAAVDNAIHKKSGGMWWLPVLAILLAIIPLAYYYTSNSKIETEKHPKNSISMLNSGNDHSNTANSTNSERSSRVTVLDSHQKTGKIESKKTEKQLSSSSQKGRKVHTSTSLVEQQKSSRETLTTKTSSSKNTKTKSIPSKGNTKVKKQASNKNKKGTKPNSRKKSQRNKVNSEQKGKNNLTTPSSNETSFSDPEINPTENYGEGTGPLADGSSNDENPKSDSTTKANNVAQNTMSDDSSDKPSLPATSNGNGGKPKPNNTDKNWYASVYVGPQFDLSKTENKDDATLKTKPGFRYSAEINRTIFSGYGLTSGISYHKTEDQYNTYQFDSMYVYTDTVEIYGEPNFPDSITGYEYVDIYEIDTLHGPSQDNITLSSIIIPLYITKQFDLGNNWGLLVNAGATYRMTKVTPKNGPLSSSEILTNRNSLIISGRVHATYKWNSWMFSMGMNAGYYVKPPMEYPGIKTARSYLTPEIGIHFLF